MARINLSFVEVHNPLFVNGTNLGTKINVAQRQAIAQYDTEISCLRLYFKGKTTLVPSSNIASMDAIEEQAPAQVAQPETVLPPALAKRRGRPPKEAEPEQKPIGDPVDPNDEQAAHRAAVRAASANSNVAPPNVSAQTDALIQQARMQALGIKDASRVVQVSVPGGGKVR